MIVTHRKKPLPDLIDKLKAQYAGQFPLMEHERSADVIALGKMVTKPFEPVIIKKRLLAKALLSPIRSMLLPRRACRLMLDKGAENAYEAIQLFDGPFDKESGIGPHTLNQCRLAITDFIDWLERTDVVNIVPPAATEVYRGNIKQGHDTQDDEGVGETASESFERVILKKRLLAKALLASVRSILLPKYAYRLMLKKEVDNAYEAIQLVDGSFDKEKGIGPHTLRQCRAAITDFIDWLEQTEVVDIVQLAATDGDRGSVQLGLGAKATQVPPPTQVIKPSHADNLTTIKQTYRSDLAGIEDTTFDIDAMDTLSDLPSVVRRYVNTRFVQHADRNWAILSMRFGLGTQKKQTINAISDLFSLSRKQVRYIEYSIVKEIRDLFYGEYPFNGWILSDSLIQSYMALKDHLSQDYCYVANHYAVTLARDVIDAKIPRGYVELLMNTYGYRNVPAANKIRSGWCSIRLRKMPHFSHLYLALGQWFEYPDAITLGELRKRVPQHSETDYIDAVTSLLHHESALECDT